MNVNIFVLFSRQHLEERGLFEGVRDYAEHHRLDWEVLPVHPARGMAGLISRRYRPPGVFIGRPRPPAAWLQPGLHYVAWVGEGEEPIGEAAVAFDADSIGRVAADYLRTMGARTYAIQGSTGAGRQRLARQEAFRRAVERRGDQVQVFRRDDRSTHADYLRELEALCTTMPLPIGFFTYHDLVAEALIQDLTQVGVAIPGEALVLGGNGSSASAGAAIPISTVRLPFHALGSAAATLAHRLLCGTAPESGTVLVKALGVIERASTAPTTCPADPVIHRALKRIADPRKPIPSVADLARHCRVNRQLLLRHFRGVLGTTPERWLKDRAMQRAAQLLSETDLPLEQVAAHCGIAQKSNLSPRFKQHFGIPPGAYRVRTRGARPPPRNR